MERMSWNRWTLLRVMVLGLWIALLPLTVSAEKVDWKDPGFDFHRVHRVLLADIETSAARFDSPMMEQKVRSSYPTFAKKMKCQFITGDQARRQMSLLLGVDLETMFRTDPQRASQLYRENLTKVADVWVEGKIKVWKNDYYIEPQRTVWEQKRMERRVYDRNGIGHNESYYVTVPVTYPARRVDVSSLTISFEVHDARTGRLVMGRDDIRSRQDYNAHDGMYERICKSFFSDFGDKING